MADAEQGSNEIFNVERIRELVELMKEHELSEIDLRHGEQKIRLTRGVAMVAAPLQMPAPTSLPPGSPSEAPVVPAAATSSSEHVMTISSPMVGTFYSRPNPNAEPFVKVGDNVDPETTVCIIEAMKVFNEIPAEVRGQIVAVLVDDDEPIDFGKPLFKVDTSK